MVGKKKKIKYYGVRKGHIPGIYNDWLEAHEQVNGFPGAEVQSFTNKKEAQSYMKSMNKSTNTKSTFIQALAKKKQVKKSRDTPKQTIWRQIPKMMKST